jgi:hypothetical protein
MNDNPVVKAKVGRYLLLNQEIKDLKQQQEDIKNELSPYLSAAETNARGSHVLAFEEPLEVSGQQYASLQRVKKTSKVLNEERVVRWAYENLTEYDRERLLVTVQHVDQDVLWDLFVNEELTQEELDSLQDVNVTWAFSPTKV